jgi:hypothetical protein
MFGQRLRFPITFVMFVYKIFLKNVKKSTYINLQHSKFATYYEVVIVLAFGPAGRYTHHLFAMSH